MDRPPIFRRLALPFVAAYVALSLGGLIWVAVKQSRDAAEPRALATTAPDAGIPVVHVKAHEEPVAARKPPPPSIPPEIAPALLERLQRAESALSEKADKIQRQLMTSREAIERDKVVSEIAAMLKRDPRCYLRSIIPGSPLAKACEDALAIWAIDALGHVAVQRRDAPQGASGATGRTPGGH